MKLRVPKFMSSEILRMSLDSIRAHKLRSFLTVFGIVIGVVVVIVVASLLTGVRQSVVDVIAEYGTSGRASPSRRRTPRPSGAARPRPRP